MANHGGSPANNPYAFLDPYACLGGKHPAVRSEHTLSTLRTYTHGIERYPLLYHPHLKMRSA